MDNIKNPQLKNKAIFKYKKMPFGIPDKIFIIALVLTLFAVVVFVKLTGFIVGSFFSFFFAILVFNPLIVVHKNDQDAWYYWISSLKSMNFHKDLSLTTLQAKKVDVKVLTGNSSLSIKQFNG